MESVSETNVANYFLIKKGGGALHSEFQPIPVLCFLLCCIARILKKQFYLLEISQKGNKKKELFYFVSGT